MISLHYARLHTESTTRSHSCKQSKETSPLTVSKPPKGFSLISRRTGKLLHAYGNVKASQGCLDESLEYHLRGLQQYKSTIGINHHRTGDLCVKVSDHYARLGQCDAAMYDTPFSSLEYLPSPWQDVDEQTGPCLIKHSKSIVVASTSVPKTPELCTRKGNYWRELGRMRKST